MHTEVSSVQAYGQRATWPEHVVYVGMPGKASRAFGIPDHEAIFGKPWHLVDDPRGWPTAYCEYLANKLNTDALFAQRVTALHGKTLLCYCTRKAEQRKTEVRCHARILAEYVELLAHANCPDCNGVGVGCCVNADIPLPGTER